MKRSINSWNGLRVGNPAQLILIASITPWNDTNMNISKSFYINEKPILVNLPHTEVVAEYYDSQKYQASKDYLV